MTAPHDTDIPALLDDAVAHASPPLDHAHLQTRGRRRRRTRQAAATTGGIAAIAALVITAPWLLPTDSLPSSGTDPSATATGDDADPNALAGVGPGDVVDRGCPEEIATTWTCLADGERPLVSAPDVERLGGGPADLPVWRGEAVVVSVWGSWCGPCIRQQSDLNAVHADRPDIDFLGIATEDLEDNAAEFVGTNAVDYPVLLDPSGDYTRALINAVDARPTGMGVPATYVIDAQGRIAAWTVGRTNRADLDEAILHVAS